MTVRSGDHETVYQAGDLWIEQPGDVHAAGNMGEDAARVGVTFLQRKGQTVTSAVPDANR